MITEHDRVVLTAPVTKEGLETGDVGTVVHVYADGKACRRAGGRVAVSRRLAGGA